MTLVGVCAEFFQRGWADFSTRGIDDAQKSGVVVLIHKQAQITENVLDFHVGEERGVAANKIGNVVFPQTAFE